MLGFVFLIAGILVRLDEAAWALFLGTALAGAGLAIGNVLMPAVIKSVFPDRVRLYTGIGTAVLSGRRRTRGRRRRPPAQRHGQLERLARPVGDPAALGLIVWLPLARRADRPAPASGSAAAGSLLGDAMAWQVTGYLALRALVYFTALGWLPTILADFGYSNATSGALLSLAMLVSVPGALFAPILVGRKGTSPSSSPSPSPAQSACWVCSGRRGSPPSGS